MKPISHHNFNSNDEYDFIFNILGDCQWCNFYISTGR